MSKLFIVTVPILYAIVMMVAADMIGWNEPIAWCLACIALSLIIAGGLEATNLRKSRH